MISYNYLGVSSIFSYYLLFLGDADELSALIVESKESFAL